MRSDDRALNWWCTIGEAVLNEEREGVAYPVAESNESRLAASANCGRGRLRKEDEMRRLGFEPSSKMMTLAILRSSKTSVSW